MDQHAEQSGSGLAGVVDAYVLWFARWHRLVFFPTGTADGAETHETAAASKFRDWVAATDQAALTRQPAVVRLVSLNEQLHRLARMIRLRTAADRTPPNPEEYDALVACYERFFRLLRRVERAFAAAASGLDPLTGLRTRRSLAAVLDRAVARLQRSGRPFCVAMVDIDHFKVINDRHGHDAGDRVLAAVAGAIDQGVRATDEVFRHGGEEFLVCLDDLGLDEAGAMLDRLRRRIAALSLPALLAGDDDAPPPPKPTPNADTTITASFGVVEATADADPNQLIAAADAALYRAKAAGRNRVEALRPGAPASRPDARSRRRPDAAGAPTDPTVPATQTDGDGDPGASPSPSPRPRPPLKAPRSALPGTGGRRPR